MMFQGRKTPTLVSVRRKVYLVYNLSGHNT
jgi:hypothetical protein